MLPRLARHPGITATLAILAVTLTACGPIGSICHPLSALEKAASYDWLLNEGHYSEPLNAWVRNEELESFLAKAVRLGGIDALRSQYGFQCSQRSVTPPCVDCYTCSLSLAKTQSPREPRTSVCATVGEMLVRVDVGPGSALTAMTYWQREPVHPRR